VRLEHYTDEYIHDPNVLALIKKITLLPNLPLGKNQAGRLTVKLKDGRSFQPTVSTLWAGSTVLHLSKRSRTSS